MVRVMDTTNSLPRSGFSKLDEEILPIWREHGIPLDRTTVDHALKMIDQLVAEVNTLWEIIDHLGGWDA